VNAETAQPIVSPERAELARHHIIAFVQGGERRVEALWDAAEVLHGGRDDLRVWAGRVVAANLEAARKVAAVDAADRVF